MASKYHENMNQAFEDVRRELLGALVKNGPFGSRHEGYAIMLEEVDELWDEIKQDGESSKVYAEAMQVAAMATELMVNELSRMQVEDAFPIMDGSAAAPLEEHPYLNHAPIVGALPEKKARVGRPLLMGPECQCEKGTGHSCIGGHTTL